MTTKEEGEEVEEKTEAMESALSLFRVFDVAFFAPGGVLFFALLSCDLIAPGQFDTSLGSVGKIGLTVVLIYVLGVVCHASHRALAGLFKRCGFKDAARSEADHGPWYSGLARKRREDLAMYFWYMRATAWNLAVATAISGVMLSIAGIKYQPSSPNPLQKLAAACGAPLLAGAVLCALLIFLGLEFDRALRRAIKVQPRPPGGASTAP